MPIDKVISAKYSIWEYHVTHLDASKLNISEKLDNLGSIGWELITAQWDNCGLTLSCVFKRNKE